MSLPEEITTQLLPYPTRVPARAAATSGDGAVKRLVFCPLYQQCLDVAVRNGWEDWTCRRCPLAAQQTTPSAAGLATRQPSE